MQYVLASPKKREETKLFFAVNQCHAISNIFYPHNYSGISVQRACFTKESSMQRTKLRSSTCRAKLCTADTSFQRTQFGGSEVRLSTENQRYQFISFEIQSLPCDSSYGLHWGIMQAEEACVINFISFDIHCNDENIYFP